MASFHPSCLKTLNQVLFTKRWLDSHICLSHGEKKTKNSLSRSPAASAKQTGLRARRRLDSLKHPALRIYDPKKRHQTSFIVSVGVGDGTLNTPDKNVRHACYSMFYKKKNHEKHQDKRSAAAARRINLYMTERDRGDIDKKEKKKVKWPRS